MSQSTRQALPKEELKRFNKVIGLVQAAYGQRTAFVHAKWGANGAEPEKPWQFSVRTKGGRLSIVQKPTPVSELQKAASQIWDAGETLGKELMQYGMLQSEPRMRL